MGLNTLRLIGLEDARAKLDSASRIVRQVIDTGGGEPGTDFTRMAIAKAMGLRSSLPPEELAVRRWGSASRVVGELKAAVPGGSSTSWADLPGSAGGEFLDLVRPLTALGRLPGVRTVPANVPGVVADGDSVGYWVGEGKSIPLSAAVFNRESLSPKKVGAMTVASREILESTDPAAERLVRNSLLRAVALASDASFLLVANGGDANTPASLTNGAETFASAGDLSDDLGEALERFEGDLQRAAWITHPGLAARIALRSGGGGIGKNLGALGGELLGLPVIVSAGSAVDQLVLADGGALITVDGGIEVTESQHALVEMNDAPTGDSLTPAAATVHRVSMFQSNSVAFKAVRYTNWMNTTSSKSVVVITGMVLP